MLIVGQEKYNIIDFDKIDYIVMSEGEYIELLAYIGDDSICLGTYGGVKYAQRDLEKIATTYEMNQKVCRLYED